MTRGRSPRTPFLQKAMEETLAKASTREAIAAAIRNPYRFGTVLQLNLMRWPAVRFEGKVMVLGRGKQPHCFTGIVVEARADSSDAVGVIRDDWLKGSWVPIDA